MVKLPDPMHRTAREVYARHERDAEDWRREHLGASVIGGECQRELWYGFRWASPPDFGGRMLRLFERGQREEEWIVEELRALGMRVETVDKSLPMVECAPPRAGDFEHPQYRFSHWGGHFGGSIDGAVLGVLEAPKTWHLLEVKTSNDKRFKVLQKDGVEKSNPKHYAQMQIYMHAMKLKRALYVCVNKNDDTIFTERLYYSRDAALAILAKAEMVIGSPEPLTRISEDPTWWECKFCSQRPHCHLGEVERLERNCRTCASSTPLPNGKWNCEHHGCELDLEAQRKGCDDHLFIPALLPWEPVNVDEAKRLVTYLTKTGEHVTDTGTGLLAIP